MSLFPHMWTPGSRVGGPGGGAPCQKMLFDAHSKSQQVKLLDAAVTSTILPLPLDCSSWQCNEADKEKDKVQDAKC